MARGMAAGPSRPYHAPASNPAKRTNPASATVGTSGMMGERFNPPSAMAFKRPAFTCGTDCATLPNDNDTSPLMVAVTAGALPLYGTTITLMPAVFLNNSAASCDGLPPHDQVISPGRARASAISSLTLRTGSCGCAINR